jgi:predicted transcriptional regulator
VCNELLSELGYLKHVRPPSPPDEDEQRRRDFASLVAALRVRSVPLADLTFGARWSGLQATVNMMSQAGLITIEGSPGQETVTLTRAGKELLSDQD